MIVLIDVDGVVCDMFPKWVQLYNEEWGDNLDVADFENYDDFWRRIRPEATKRMEEYLAMGEELYGLNTEAVPGAKVALNRLRAAGDSIAFVTACHGSGMFDYKVAWLEQREMLTPNRGLIATHRNAPKWLVRGDVLIDDSPENVTEFIRHGGIGILFSQPWNRNDVAIARMESWDEIEEDGMAGWLKRNVMEVAA